MKLLKNINFWFAVAVVAIIVWWIGFVWNHESEPQPVLRNTQTFADIQEKLQKQVSEHKIPEEQEQTIYVNDMLEAEKEQSEIKQLQGSIQMLNAKLDSLLRLQNQKNNRPRRTVRSKPKQIRTVSTGGYPSPKSLPRNASYESPPSLAFDLTKQAQTEKPPTWIKLYLAKGKRVYNETRILFSVVDPFKLNGTGIPTGSVVDGVCKIGANKIDIKFSTFSVKNQTFNIEAEAFDIDKNKGLRLHIKKTNDARAKLKNSAIQAVDILDPSGLSKALLNKDKPTNEYLTDLPNDLTIYALVKTAIELTEVKTDSLQKPEKYVMQEFTIEKLLEYRSDLLKSNRRAKAIKVGDIFFAVERIFYFKDKLVFKCTLKNSSKLPYHINQIRITYKKTQKLLHDYYVQFQEQQVVPGAIGHIIYVTEKFGLKKGSKLTMEVREKYGDRHVNFDIAYNTM